MLKVQNSGTHGLGGTHHTRIGNKVQRPTLTHKSI